MSQAEHDAEGFLAAGREQIAWNARGWRVEGGRVDVWTCGGASWLTGHGRKAQGYF